MLNQKRSGSLARLKYLAAVPLCVGMLCASTLVFSKDYAFIDLAPKAKPVEKPAKVKRFKIVDGKNTIYGDSFTDNKTGKLYTVTNITAEDVRYFLKTRNLKIEIVEMDESAAKISTIVPLPGDVAKVDTNKRKLPPPPPPVPVKDGYLKLAQHISRSIEYPQDAIAKRLNASLVASFTLGTDGRISDISVAGTGDDRFKKATEEGIAKFSYPIKDKAGRKQMGINFTMLGDEVPAIAASVKNGPGFVGESGVTGMTEEQKKEYFRHLPPPPPPARPKKVGAVKGVKPAPPVVIADVNPKAVPTISIEPVAKVKAAPKVLIDVKPVAKTVPEITIDPVPTKAAKPAKVKPVKAAPPVIKPDASFENSQSAVGDFSRQIARTVRYPTSARNREAEGAVLVRFRVSGSKIFDVKVVRGVNDALDAETKRALEQYSAPLTLKPGLYFTGVAFALERPGENNNPQVDPKDIKELQVADIPNTGERAHILNPVVVVSYL